MLSLAVQLAALHSVRLLWLGKRVVPQAGTQIHISEFRSASLTSKSAQSTKWAADSQICFAAEFEVEAAPPSICFWWLFLTILS